MEDALYTDYYYKYDDPDFWGFEGAE